MSRVTVSWWDSSGNEQTIPVDFGAGVPRVGEVIDLEGLDDEYVAKHLSEDEAVNLNRLKVTGVVYGFPGITVEVERDPEFVHQQELESKDASIAHVQKTTKQALHLLQLVLGDGVFVDLDGGGDDRDTIALHVAEGTTLDPDLIAEIDAIFVYPSQEAAKKRDTSRRCIKHRHAELVTKGTR